MDQEPYRVLVIDDDVNLRKLLKLLFDFRGYQVFLAPDGEVGLALAEGGRPDIIVLDVAMPHRNGMEVYLDLQNNPLTGGIPILVCSAALNLRDIEAWRGLPQVMDILLKPFDVNDMIARIDAVCKQRASEVGI